MKHLHNFTIIAFILLFSVINNSNARDNQEKLLISINNLSKMKINISCNKNAQQMMNKGAWLNQHKLFAKAENTFKTMVEKYPDCAMAHWGYAITLLHPSRANKVSQADLIKGYSALNTAVYLNPKTQREISTIAITKNIASQIVDISGIDTNNIVFSSSRNPEQ